MQTALLYDIVIIFALSVAILFICHRLKTPAIVGFLLTGIVAGPYGLGLVKAVHEVEVLADIGVVLLLFTIGMEFSLEKLLRIRKSVLLGGSFQVLVTIAVASLVARQFGQPIGQSIFIGFLVSLSSTAIVLKLVQQRAEVDSPHGQTTLGILIFQDIIIVPMILLTPMLAGTSVSTIESVLFLFAKAIGIILLVIISAKWIVPQVLYHITKTRSQELFLLTVVVICLSIAWITSAAGLSLALGAFLAGLIISESEYSHHAIGNISPFRDVFTTFFFVSIGMLLDIEFFFKQPGTIILIAFAVLAVKSLIAAFAAISLGLQLRTSILVGLGLGQVGEFSFILSKTGLEHDLLSGDFYQIFLAFSVLTMAATPFIINLAPRIADAVLKMPLPQKLKNGFAPVPEIQVSNQKDHLVIVGYGVNGRNVASAARMVDIPYIIIEMNPETVRSEQAKGEAIYYGDASQEAVLQHVNIKNAKVAVVAINDPPATRRITETIRGLNPKVHLIVRTRYLREMDLLRKSGADDIVPEEFETSVEIFTLFLRKYLVPRDEIERIVAKVRAEGYGIFRGVSKKSASVSDLKLHLPDFEIGTLRVGDRSPLVGESLARLELRRRYGVTVLAIRRNSEILSNPAGDARICANDVLFVLGLPDKIIDVAGLTHNPK
jgi:CPA2 family monovalent cation:H+ antiporter-2